MKKQGRGYIWTEEEESYLIQNYSSDKLDHLTEYFSRSKQAIFKKAQKLGLKIDRAKADYNRYWSKKETEYLTNNYEFGDIDEIAKTLNRTRKAITERAKLLKLRRDEEIVRKISQKYSVNEDFFATWSSDMAYILGLICADGNISSSSNSISIVLHKNDSYLISEVYEAMNSTHKVRFNANMAIFNINNMILYKDLLKLGVTPNKSKTLKCPNVPQDFIPDFFRGVMDGDGSVDSKNKRLKVVSASKDFIYGLGNLLDKINIGHKIYNEPYTYNGTKTDFYTIRVIRRKDVKSIYNMMYKDTDLYLTRKKQSFEHMGIKSKDFIIKCKVSMRPIVGISGKKTISFGSVKEARIGGFPRIFSALKSGKAYKGYTWRYKE